MSPKKENNNKETKENKENKKKATNAKKTSSSKASGAKATAKKAVKKTVVKKAAKPKEMPQKQEEINTKPTFSPEMLSMFHFSTSTPEGKITSMSQQQEQAVKQEPQTETKKEAKSTAPQQAIEPASKIEQTKSKPEAETKEIKKTTFLVSSKEELKEKKAADKPVEDKQQQNSSKTTQQKSFNQPKQVQKEEIRFFNQPNSQAKPAGYSAVNMYTQDSRSKAKYIPPIMRPAQKAKPSEIPAIMRPSPKPKHEEKPAIQQTPHKDIKQEITSLAPKSSAKTQAAPKEQAIAAHSSSEQKSSLPKIKLSTEFVVRDLAEKLNVKPTDFIKKLISMGVFATINQRLDKDTAIIMAAEYGYDLELVPMLGEEELEEELKQEDAKNLKLRNPIITIMGHVDHGKTTLLDALRESNVVATEAGQITQHIGAYMVQTSRGKITVLDTPGHEAFTAMRANGVKVTDIVVLVVSAVDGVMPQTIEAINHAKAANVPIIVAVNKIDLPTANTQQIKQQLSNYGLVAEEWGGQTPMIEISAKKRLNLDKLLEIISIQAELMELKANPDRLGQAIVVEARLDAKKGVVATIIDITGTLKPSDPFTVGTAYGKVRALIGDRGERLNELKPGEPAEVLGISGEVPQAGDILKVAASDKEARHISEKRKLSRREEALSHQKQVSLMSLKSQVENNELRTLNIVLKTDVFGSLQAIKDSLEKISTQEVAINILHSGVGNITESDVLLAKASNAVIIGFHVDSDSKVSEAAKSAEVEIRSYQIIYDLLEDIKAAMSGLLAPEIVEVATGKAEIQQIFDLSSGKICGSLAREGKITRGQQVHIIRGSDIVGNAKITGLKRFKDDVREVEKGLECGILLEGFKDFQVGDIIEAFNTEEKIRRLTNV